eukprot:COSAG05_NODE_2170_length_3442_cov_3.273706_3_plen_227_part_00
MPGGLVGVRALVDDLHSAGVKVLFPYHPWDTATRRELCGDSGKATIAALNCTPGKPVDDADAMAAMIVATGADGINGDTMTELPSSLYFRMTQATGRPIALEAEMGLSTRLMAWSTLMWAERWQYVPSSTWKPEHGDMWPMITSNKWVSNGSFMVHLTERWAQNKEAMAATAFFNGHGLNSWENVYAPLISSFHQLLYRFCYCPHNLVILVMMLGYLFADGGRGTA